MRWDGIELCRRSVHILSSSALLLLLLHHHHWQLRLFLFPMLSCRCVPGVVCVYILSPPFTQYNGTLCHAHVYMCLEADEADEADETGTYTMNAYVKLLLGRIMQIYHFSFAAFFFFFRSFTL